MGEHRPDTAGVGGSSPPGPTLQSHRSCRWLFLWCFCCTVPSWHGARSARWSCPVRSATSLRAWWRSRSAQMFLCCTLASLAHRLWALRVPGSTPLTKWSLCANRPGFLVVRAAHSLLCRLGSRHDRAHPWMGRSLFLRAWERVYSPARCAWPHPTADLESI